MNHPIYLHDESGKKSGFRTAGLWLGLALTGSLALAGCTASRQPLPVWAEPVPVLTADSASQAWLAVDLCFPREALNSRHRLIVVPQLVQQGRVVAEYPAVAVDAPVYARKLRRRVQLYGFADSLAGRVSRFPDRGDLRVPYRQRIACPPGTAGGRVIGVVSSDGCGSCGVVDTLDLAYLSDLRPLLRPTPCRSAGDPVWEVRPKVMHGQGEARLQFPVNQSVIDVTLGRNAAELEGMSAVLGRIFGDSLATVTSVRIEGLASADGPAALNARLAARRAEAAQAWLVGRLSLGRKEQTCFRLGSRPEGWEPVLAAMRADGHPDTARVAELLERHAGESDDVAERYIRRLSGWNDIKNRYLSADRRVVYAYSYTLKSFTTDAELLAMYARRPDAFSEAELWRVAAMMPTSARRSEVYRTVLRFFPGSILAKSRLAADWLEQGDDAAVVAALLPLAEAWEASAGVACGAVKAADGPVEATGGAVPVAALQSEVRTNLGQALARLGRWTEAYRWLRTEHSAQAALVSLCVAETEQAGRQLAASGDSSPLAAYLQAVVHARLHQSAAFWPALRRAVTDASLRRRAADEVEFKEFWSHPDFAALVAAEAAKGASSFTNGTEAGEDALPMPPKGGGRK